MIFLFQHKTYIILHHYLTKRNHLSFKNYLHISSMVASMTITALGFVVLNLQQHLSTTAAATIETIDNTPSTDVVIIIYDYLFLHYFCCELFLLYYMVLVGRNRIIFP